MKTDSNESKPDSALEVLAVAPHPDDAELFCGGTLALLVSQGHAVGILDATAGELSSQGSPETRKEEAGAASQILGLKERRNLGLPDGGVNAMDPGQLIAAVGVLRRLRPELLLLPYWEDRHPDHVQTSELFTRAVFFAGLQKYSADLGHIHRVLQVLYYPVRETPGTSVVVDVSAVHGIKLASIACYASQVKRQPGGAEGSGTLVSSPLSISSVTARDAYFGSMLGAEYGEPFLLKTTVRLNDPLKFFRENAIREPLQSPGVRV